MNTLVGEIGRVKFYQCNLACINLPVENEDGYLYVFKWSTGKYATQVFIDPNTDKTYIRSNRSPDTINWEPWSEYSMDIPSFYKDYANINSLASALGGLSVEFLKQQTQHSVWEPDDDETLNDIPLTTLIFWYNSQVTNGCGVFLKDGTRLLDIARTANYFEFTSETAATLKIRAKTIASGYIKIFCVRP